MAPKYHPTPLFRRRPQSSEQGARQGARDGQYSRHAVGRDAAKAATVLKQADKLRKLERAEWSDGEPIDPSPTIDQAVNGGFPSIKILRNAEFCSLDRVLNEPELGTVKVFSGQQSASDVI